MEAQKKHMEKGHLSSPQLRHVLDQLARAGVFSTEISDELFQTFLEAVARSGAEEIGFERPSGQSFNPRAARITLILLGDCGIDDPGPIRSALQAAGRGGEYRDYLAPDRPAAPDQNIDPRLAGAFLLDRLRHLHLENDPELEPVLSRSQKVSEELRTLAPKLSLLLEKGVDRIRRLKIGDASRS